MINKEINDLSKMNFGYNGRKVKFPADEKIVVHFDTQDPWQPETGKSVI